MDFDVVVAAEPADGVAVWAENGNRLSNDINLHTKRSRPTANAVHGLQFWHLREAFEQASQFGGSIAKAIAATAAVVVIAGAGVVVEGSLSSDTCSSISSAHLARQRWPTLVYRGGLLQFCSLLDRTEQCRSGVCSSRAAQFKTTHRRRRWRSWRRWWSRGWRNSHLKRKTNIIVKMGLKEKDILLYVWQFYLCLKYFLL